FIGSFLRTTDAARKSLLDMNAFGLPLHSPEGREEMHGFHARDNAFTAWHWDGPTVIAYLESLASGRNADFDRAQAATVISSALVHDEQAGFRGDKVLRANSIQKDQIRKLLKALLPNAPPADEALAGKMTAELKGSKSKARRQVFGSSGFWSWRGLFSGWFSMWFVNTEIAFVLGQLGVFDGIFSKIANSEIHIFEQLGQLIEGANEEHPVATSGIRLYGPDSFLGQFASARGGMLGVFHSIVGDARSAMGGIPVLGDIQNYLVSLPAVLRSYSEGKSSDEAQRIIEAARQQQQLEEEMKRLQESAQNNTQAQEPGRDPLNEILGDRLGDAVDGALDALTGGAEAPVEESDPGEIDRWLDSLELQGSPLTRSFEGRGPDDTFANTYDQALVALNALTNNDTARAREILDYFQKMKDVPARSNTENSQVTGEILWIGLAAEQYAARTGDAARYNGLLQRTDAYLLSRQSSEGYIYGTRTENWVSTEHNLDALEYLTLRLRMVGDGATAQRLRESRALVARYLVERAYIQDEKGDHFITGLDGNAGQDNRSFATDTSSWGVGILLAVRAMDPEFFAESGLAGIDLEALLDAADSHSRINDYAYTLPDGTVVHVNNLYRFEGENPGSPPSIEFSAQMALAYSLLAEQYKQREQEMWRQGEPRAAVEYRREAAQMNEKAAAIRADIEKLRFENGSLPASGHAGTTFRQGGWQVSRDPAVAATLWGGGMNPFMPFSPLEEPLAPVQPTVEPSVEPSVEPTVQPVVRSRVNAPVIPAVPVTLPAGQGTPLSSRPPVFESEQPVPVEPVIPPAAQNTPIVVPETTPEEYAGAVGDAVWAATQDKARTEKAWHDALREAQDARTPAEAGDIAWADAKNQGLSDAEARRRAEEAFTARANQYGPNQALQSFLIELRGQGATDELYDLTGVKLPAYGYLTVDQIKFAYTLLYDSNGQPNDTFKDPARGVHLIIKADELLTSLEADNGAGMKALAALGTDLTGMSRGQRVVHLFTLLMDENGNGTDAYRDPAKMIDTATRANNFLAALQANDGAGLEALKITEGIDLSGPMTAGKVQRLIGLMFDENGNPAPAYYNPQAVVQEMRWEANIDTSGGAALIPAGLGADYVDANYTSAGQGVWVSKNEYTLRDGTTVRDYLREIAGANGERSFFRLRLSPSAQAAYEYGRAHKGVLL
ncbi:MAG: hypothetical protein ACYC5N_10565, partial [Endomicrobiales bacterium]